MFVIFALGDRGKRVGSSESYLATQWDWNQPEILEIISKTTKKNPEIINKKLNPIILSLALKWMKCMKYHNTITHSSTRGEKVSVLKKNFHFSMACSWVLGLWHQTGASASVQTFGPEWVMVLSIWARSELPFLGQKYYLPFCTNFLVSLRNLQICNQGFRE